MARAFASWVDVHPDDGRFILNNGYDWSYLRVEATPFFVLGMREAEDSLLLGLSDGSESRLEPSTLSAGAGGALFTTVKGGKFTARFTRAAQISLGRWLVAGENGRLSLEIAGHRHALGNFGEGP